MYIFFSMFCNRLTFDADASSVSFSLSCTVVIDPSGHYPPFAVMNCNGHSHLCHYLHTRFENAFNVAVDRGALEQSLFSFIHSNPFPVIQIVFFNFNGMTKIYCHNPKRIQLFEVRKVQFTNLFVFFVQIRGK